MVENQVWEAIPGTRGVMIYAITRKPDVSCSNAYILKTPAEIVIIDTGADPDQMEQIKQQIRTLEEECPRPVFLFFTHCHVDHCYQAMRDTGFWQIASIRVAAAGAGAAALEVGDPVLTVGELLGWDVTPIRVDVNLLLSGDLECCRSTDYDLGDGIGISVISERVGDTLYRQRIPLANGDMLEVYPAPGHSPDSICIRVGGILFTGDLLFSMAPGVAGLAGWDRVALLDSIDRIRWLLEHEQITLCASGHGKILPASVLLRLLADLRLDASTAGEIGTFDPERLKEARNQALELLEEANRLFAVIAGRLYYLSYYLEELGEPEEARKYQALIESDKIDEFLAEFSRFTEEFQTGRKLEIQFVLKAVQIIQRIGALFAQDRLDHIIDTSLIRRAERLLADFMNTVWGYRNTESLMPVDIAATLQDLVGRLQNPPYSDEDFIELADDEEAYRAALASRIAFVPVLDGVNLVLDCPEHLPAAITEPDRLCDAVTGIFEDLSAAGIKEIRVSAESDAEHIRIRICTEGVCALSYFTQAKQQCCRRRLSLCGARMQVEEGSGGLLVSLELPVVVR